MPVGPIQEFWNKLNANERVVGYGAVIAIISWVLGIFLGGGGYGFVAAIVILVIYWLKYSNSNVTWPAPVPTLVLIIAGIAAVLGLLIVLPLLGFAGAIGAFYGGLYFLPAIGGLIGTFVMAYGAWREYQAAGKMA
jgi:hypothetical protein